MRSFTIATTILLAATSTLAAPVNSTLHFYGKRDAVCAANFRSLVDKAECLPTKEQFTLTPPSTINRVALAANELTSGPADAQCDHLVEIQLLDRVAKASGLCEMITQMIKADPDNQKKADILNKASQDISALGNLNFLASTVNNRKKTVVDRSLKGKAQQNGDLDKAVGNFLRLVQANGASVAKQLDADLSAIKTKAEAVLAALPPAGPADPDSGTRKSSRLTEDPNAKRRKPLEDAIAAFSKSTITVTSEWNKLIANAPHT
ncbi:hypothetical protein BDY19DRAFT_679542 [Irpex rosettiformis]|uniref:Uncharacterized protein n=1 Tax=Irpex rosettiformis TaxID=378272 RepID=A0ACB8U9Y9_9APHY|nr:hypothetical protein BDY19DRAFT_679542 [Irpex rosettiformis]